MRAHPLWFLLALTACSSDGTAPTGPALTGETFSVSWGPVELAPGEEGTRCITVDAGNEAAVQIHQLHNELAAVSHHLIVYRVDDPDAVLDAAPVECNPFAGALSPTMGAVPMMITQKHDELLELPAGVAYSFAPHQRVRLELHYFNATDAVAVATAKTTFHVGTPELIENEASFLFIGTPDIQLQPGAAATVSAYFTPPPGLEGAQFYAITGHTHQLGTDMRVQISDSRDGARKPVYAPSPFLWAEPLTARHEPAFELPRGGGFAFACDYRNTTPHVVEFGESANDEMCFFWAYYYPSQGARMCVHSALAGGPDGLDVCCPAEPGDQLSKYVCDQLASE